jgi:hypothetical protein
MNPIRKTARTLANCFKLSILFNIFCIELFVRTATQVKNSPYEIDYCRDAGPTEDDVKDTQCDMTGIKIVDSEPTQKPTEHKCNYSVSHILKIFNIFQFLLHESPVKVFIDELVWSRAVFDEIVEIPSILFVIEFLLDIHASHATQILILFDLHLIPFPDRRVEVL